MDLHWVTRKFPAHAEDRVFSAQKAPSGWGPALVLGAGVYSDGEPTLVLEERLRTALELYKKGKATWFLVSGDNRKANYNEPQAMRRWLQRQGVPADRIVTDFAGRRTYDSLQRASLVFGVQRAYLVTSDFHLPRALYLAHHLGLDAYGVPASTDTHSRGKRLGFWFREYGARHKALFDLWFPPDVRLGPKEPTPDAPTEKAP
jgi:vancomycin permeability regulator SanA